VPKSLPQEPTNLVDSSSIALGSSHCRPTYYSMKIRTKMPTAQKTEYLILLVESTSSVLAVKSDIQDLNPKYRVDKHLCHGVVDLENNFSLAAYGVENGDVMVLHMQESELLTVHFNVLLTKKSDCDTTRIIYLLPHPPELLMWSMVIGLPQCKSNLTPTSCALNR
jgi:hypothetical protein